MRLATVVSIAEGCRGRHPPLIVQQLLITAILANAHRGDRTGLAHTAPDGKPVLQPQPAAALQQQDKIDKMKVVHNTEAEHRPSQHQSAPTTTRLINDFQGKRQTIHDSETQSTMSTDTANMMRRSKQENSAIHLWKKLQMEAVKHMLEEAKYAVQTVPLWLHGTMYALNAMIGVMVIYILHTRKYRPRYGCATVFCLLCCWPCGILGLCFPIDEATPDRSTWPVSRRDSLQRPQNEEGHDGREFKNQPRRQIFQKPKPLLKGTPAYSRPEPLPKGAPTYYSRPTYPRPEGPRRQT